MTAWDWLRVVIMAADVMAIVAWIYTGIRYRRYRVMAGALSFLVSALAFFVLRLFYHNVTVLNYISLGLYLMVIGLLAAMSVRVRR